MPTDWIEVTIHSDLDAGELLGALDDPAITGAWQEDGLIRLYWQSAQWSGESLIRLQQMLKTFRTPGARIAVDRLPEKDWNVEWARQVKPLRIGRRVVIRPSWESVTTMAGDIELIIDPKQAFGTGHHVTTQLMIELMEESVHGGERVLDVGTGSGILAMVALRLGASTAVAIDTDRVAIDCARSYAVENHFGPELQLLPGSLDAITNRPDDPFDLVLANLDWPALRDSRLALTSYLSAGARLLASGFLAEQRDEVVALFAEAQAGLCRKRERDGWGAIELLLPESCDDPRL